LRRRSRTIRPLHLRDFCAAAYSTQAADAAIDAYCDFTAPAVLEELAQVRHPLTLPAVLAEVQAANRSSGYRSLEELPAAVKARITDVEPLATLTTLRSLSLGNTRVTDLRPLQTFTNLQYLSLWNTKVTDLRPLEGLTNLQRLDLRGTEVAHEQVARLLKALPNLSYIC
jgi:Leucine-rich repeat (LRR) protein